MTEQTLSRDVVAGSRNMSKERARRLSDEQLRDLAREARFLVLSTAHNAKSGHIGGSLSAMDMLIALFFDRLRIVPRGMSPARFDKSESVDPDQARQATITAPGGAGDYDILLVDESPGVRDTLVVDRRPLTVR